MQLNVPFNAAVRYSNTVSANYLVLNYGTLIIPPPTDPCHLHITFLESLLCSRF